MWVRPWQRWQQFRYFTQRLRALPIATGRVSDYPIDFRQKTRFTAGPIIDGIPHTLTNVGPVALATTVSLFGLGMMQEGRITEAIRVADWLVERLSSAPSARGAGWPQRAVPPRGLTADGWISAMTQGVGISVLIRVGAVTGRTEYMRGAVEAGTAMLAPVSEGGTALVEADGAAFFEEFPSPCPSRVLNGHLFALQGLHDLSEYGGAELASEAWLAGMRALARWLPRYDWHGWSLYELRDRNGVPRASSGVYHHLHVAQLRAVLAVRHVDPGHVQVIETVLGSWERHLSLKMLAMGLIVPGLKVARRVGRLK